MSLEQYCDDKRVLVQSADATAHDALRAVIAQRTSAVLVHEDGRLTGIATARDLTSRTVGADRDPKQTKLRDVMTPEPVTLPLDASKEEAAELMRARGVRQIPIIAEGRAIGIVTFDDLLMTGDVDLETASGIVEAQLAQCLDIAPAAASGTLRIITQSLSQLISERDVAHLADQLPKDMKALLRSG